MTAPVVLLHQQQLDVGTWISRMRRDSCISRRKILARPSSRHDGARLGPQLSSLAVVGRNVFRILFPPGYVSDDGDGRCVAALGGQSGHITCGGSGAVQSPTYCWNGGCPCWKQY